MDKQDLLQVLKWAWVADTECQMNSADYDLAMKIAVMVDNPILAEEYANSRRWALENEARAARRHARLKSILAARERERERERLARLD